MKKLLETILSVLLRDEQVVEYPRSVAEVLNDNIVYRKATLDALCRFKKLRPFRGTAKEIEAKFRSLHKELCEIYGVSPRLKFSMKTPSCYVPRSKTVIVQQESGRYSVVAYLHEFRHALGTRNEYKTCEWSINLFRKVFPEHYEKLVPVGHLLVKSENAERYRQLMQ